MLDVVTASSQARRHLERVDWVPRGEVDLGRWPFTIPAVAQLVHDGGLEVPAGVSLLVGENGSGKSSLIEALAAAYPRPVTSPFARVGGPNQAWRIRCCRATSAPGSTRWPRRMGSSCGPR
jgi:hypothetical protein